MTPQRELIISSFFECGKHVSVDDLYQRVRAKDGSIGYSTVWRNLKLICEVGLAEEVNIGDGITRYDRVTTTPHGHLFCHECKRFIEIEIDDIVEQLRHRAAGEVFTIEGFKIEVQGICSECGARQQAEMAGSVDSDGETS